MAFPDASTTGVRAGTSLTSVNGDFTSSHAGQIIDARDVSGTIFVNHPDVTIRNCQAGRIFVTETGSSVTIEDSEIVGIPTWNSGVTILGANGTVQRCDISGVERGIWLESDNSLIENNYIHNLINNTGTHDPHIDGIQIPGHGAIVSDVIIRNNNLDLARDVSASITMRDATNVDIYNNQLSGGSYIIYFEGNTTGAQVTNNVFGEYSFGYIAGTAADSQTYSGNVYGDTSSPPPAVTNPPPAVASPHPAVTTGNSSQSDPGAPAAPATQTMNANSSQTDSYASYVDAGPMGWGGPFSWVGSHDSFAFAANYGRGVTTDYARGVTYDFSAFQGGYGHNAAVGRTPIDNLAADLADAAHAPRSEPDAVDATTLLRDGLIV